MLKGRYYLIPLVLGFISFIIFTFSPSTIDNDGILREPFYLIVFGYLGILSAFILFLISFIVKNSRRKP
jgi:hypothetical protein